MENFDKIIISTRRTSAGTEYKIDVDGNVTYFTDDDINQLQYNNLNIAVSVLVCFNKHFSHETKN